MRIDACDAKGHLTPIRRELHGVRKEVRDHLLEPIFVSHDLAKALFEPDVHANPLRRRGRLRRFDRGSRHDGEIDALHAHPDLPGDDSRHIQEIFDELGLRPGIPLDDGKALPQMGVILDAVREKPSPPENRRQWGEELMRHRGQELVFFVTRALELTNELLAFVNVRVAPDEVDLILYPFTARRLRGGE